jgi:hypothetical protein
MLLIPKRGELSFEIRVKMRRRYKRMFLIAAITFTDGAFP